ncbi:Neuronal growth regulator 1 [Anabarilius grahami]|uniref:Neuronal growth regulator 1 n=1 Tax=Anabarilius grahami TaxID=495550 RepID=A0A3N0YEJ0_ANAGA|nr:Neuronal growth regulator 1 [Anabarilius grahami]
MKTLHFRRLFLSGSEVPPAIHEMKSHGVRPGQIALLRCEAAAVPSPVFEWYKGEKRINMGQGIDIKNLSSRSVLTVKNMTQDRYGNYTCVAVNRLGTANASVPLIHMQYLQSTTIVTELTTFLLWNRLGYLLYCMPANIKFIPKVGIVLSVVMIAPGCMPVRLTCTLAESSNTSPVFLLQTHTTQPCP